MTSQSGISGVEKGSPYARAHRELTNPYATRATRKPRRIADQDFHLWPRLAWRCEVCGNPIDKVTYPVHPTCEATR